MAKFGDLVQLAWIDAGRHRFTEPPNMIKGIEFVGPIPPVTVGQEWQCRVVRDTEPKMRQRGVLRLTFVQVVQLTWTLVPYGPKLYGEQDVEPRQMCGIRSERSSSPPPAEVEAEAGRRKQAYAAAIVRAREALAPFFLHRRGPVVEETHEVELPELAGRLFTRLARVRHRIGPFAMEYSFVNEDEDTVWQNWCFLPKGEKEAEEIGRTPIATNLGRRRLILDVAHTLSELGPPQEIRCVGANGEIQFIWERDASGEASILLTLASTKHGYPEPAGTTRMEQALASPIGPALRTALAEYQKWKAELTARATAARERAEAERQARREQPKPSPPAAPPPPPPPPPPATMADLHQKWRKR